MSLEHVNGAKFCWNPSVSETLNLLCDCFERSRTSTQAAELHESSERSRVKRRELWPKLKQYVPVVSMPAMYKWLNLPPVGHVCINYLHHQDPSQDWSQCFCPIYFEAYCYFYKYVTYGCVTVTEIDTAIDKELWNVLICPNEVLH